MLGVRIPPGLPILPKAKLVLRKRRVGASEVPISRGQKARKDSNTMPNKVTKFFKDVKVELQKVSWPTKNELIGSTTVVIVAVIFLGIAIGIWDFILSRVINFLLR